MQQRKTCKLGRITVKTGLSRTYSEEQKDWDTAVKKHIKPGRIMV